MVRKVICGGVINGGIDLHMIFVLDIDFVMELEKQIIG